MARTDITTTKIGVGSSDFAAPTATTIDAALVSNGVRIVCKKASRVVLRITNTAAATHWVKIRGQNAAQDPTDYQSTAIPITTGCRVLRPGGDRVQSDGCVYLDLDTGHTGAIEAYELT